MFKIKICCHQSVGLNHHDDNNYHHRLVVACVVTMTESLGNIHHLSSHDHCRHVQNDVVVTSSLYRHGRCRHHHRHVSRPFMSSSSSLPLSLLQRSPAGCKSGICNCTSTNAFHSMRGSRMWQSFGGLASIS